MDIYDYLLIVVIGLITGSINTVAGGGSLITLPVLIFMGMPSVIANATNRVAILVQNLFAMRGFASKQVKLPMPYAIYLGIASLVGGLIGAKLAIDIADDLFRRILAVVMVVAVVFTVLGNRARMKTDDTERLSPLRQVIGTAGFLLLGIYGGFLQAGIGLLMIAMLSQLNRFTLVKTNYIKVFTGLLYTIVAVGLFAWEGKIDWIPGLVLAAGQGFGAWYTSRWSVEKGDVWIRRILVVVVIALALKLWFAP